MADNKKHSDQLDEGFHEVSLDDGFHDVPLSDEEKAKLGHFADKVPDMGSVAAAGEGLAMGGTYGLSPRISGAVGGSMEKLSGAPLGPEEFPLVPGMESTKDKKLKDLYDEYKKSAEQRISQAKETHPILYHGAEFGGALASPINKLGEVGLGSAKLAKNASLPLKMAQSTLGGARIGAVAGLAGSNDLTNLPKTLESAKEGMQLGANVGAAASATGAALKTSASGTADLLRPLIGRPNIMAREGYNAGLENAPKLSSEGGQLQDTQMRGEFANNFIDEFHKILKSDAKNKRVLISQALDNSQLAPQEAVDAVTQKYLDANPKLNDPTAIKELQDLKNIILNAKAGPQQVETVRQYLPNAPKRPLPSDEPIPVSPQSEGIPAQAEAIPQESPAPPSTDSTAQKTNIPMSSAESPSDFAGYESVHKATIDPADEEARALFQHKVHEKLADEEALGQNSNAHPVEIHESPLPNGQVRLIAKRAKVQENADAFKEQAAQLAQQQREDQRLQALLDQQQSEKLKFQQQQDAELNKPQFQDVQQTVRPNDRNLQNPEELYSLYNNLKAKSQFSEGRGFGSQEMNQMSGQAAKDVAALIKQSIPETVPIDQRLTAVNNIFERLGIDTSKLDLPGGEGEKAQADAMNKLLKMINPESASDVSTMSQDAKSYLQSELQKIDPEMAEHFNQKMDEFAKSKGLVSEFKNPGIVGGGGPILSAVRKGVNKLSYNTGYAAGNQVKKIKADFGPAIEGVQKAFQKYTPDVIQNAASRAAASTDPSVQKLGQVLSKMATADERSRNAMMFTLQQNPGYRQMLTPLFPEENPSTPQAKDMSLEQYK